MNNQSLSGQEVTIQGYIFLNNSLKQERQEGKAQLNPMMYNVVVPKGNIQGGVNGSIYDAYRSGLDSSCSDLAICTIKPDDQPAILLSKRKPTKCFGGYWWIHGGVYGSYSNIEEETRQKASDEIAKPIANSLFLIGLFRTCAPPPHHASTTNICYVTLLPYADIEGAITDKNHNDIHLFTLEDLNQIPKEEQYWYPMTIAKIALKTTPTTT